MARSDLNGQGKRRAPVTKHEKVLGCHCRAIITTLKTNSTLAKDVYFGTQHSSRPEGVVYPCNWLLQCVDPIPLWGVLACSY